MTEHTRIVLLRGICGGAFDVQLQLPNEIRPFASVYLVDQRDGKHLFGLHEAKIHDLIDALRDASIRIEVERSKHLMPSPLR